MINIVIMVEDEEWFNDDFKSTIYKNLWTHQGIRLGVLSMKNPLYHSNSIEGLTFRDSLDDRELVEDERENIYGESSDAMRKILDLSLQDSMILTYENFEDVYSELEEDDYVAGLDSIINIYEEYRKQMKKNPDMKMIVTQVKI